MGVTSAPEPSTALLFISALAALLWRRRAPLRKEVELCVKRIASHLAVIPSRGRERGQREGALDVTASIRNSIDDGTAEISVRTHRHRAG